MGGGVPVLFHVARQGSASLTNTNRRSLRFYSTILYSGSCASSFVQRKRWNQVLATRSCFWNVQDLLRVFLAAAIRRSRCITSRRSYQARSRDFRTFAFRGIARALSGRSSGLRWTRATNRTRLRRSKLISRDVAHLAGTPARSAIVNK